MLIALLHGLLFLFLIPPWQHYDEPNHFEYVWLVGHRTAELGRLPQPGDFFPRLSYRVIESMLKYGFYDRMAAQPQMPAPEKDLHIPGYPQLDDPPLYYLLAALPARLFRPMAILRQLYAARLVSIFLYLLAIIAGWGAARELAPPGHPLRWLAPLLLAALPGLAELMSAVNDDALAIAVFAWFLWGSLRLLLRGPSVLNLLWVLALAALSVFVKNTAMVTIAVLPAVLLFGVMRGRLRRIAWGLAAAVLIVAPLVIFKLDDAAAWYRTTPQAAGLRQAANTPLVGGHVLAVAASNGQSKRQNSPVYQVVPPHVAATALGKPVTFGVWMWSDQPGQAQTPLLKAGSAVFSETVSLSTAPQFFAFQAQLPPGSDRIWIFIQPGQNAAGAIYYDGLVLAPGERPLEQPPKFSGDDGLSGEWGGQPFTNLLRNPSFETPGLRLRPQLDALGVRFLPDHTQPSLVLASFLDFAGAGYFYRVSIIHLFQTFWARFAWGQVPLVWGWAYALPAIITVAGLLGCLAVAVRRRSSLPWEVIAVSLLALALAWSLALVRGAAYLGVTGYFYPTARYAYPASIALLIAIAAGWCELSRGKRYGPLALLILIGALDILSFISVATFYGRI